MADTNLYILAEVQDFYEYTFHAVSTMSGFYPKERQLTDTEAKLMSVLLVCLEEGNDVRSTVHQNLLERVFGKVYRPNTLYQHMSALQNKEWLENISMHTYEVADSVFQDWDFEPGKSIEFKFEVKLAI